ncbi:MAG: translational GTPase TypA [Prolixibacteraceae bacterium]|nr:translational GTPase TypA [Prolixibacteraceae bacterium]
MQNKNIRNIAIIAHVDHGKTTLVDKIIYFCHLIKDHEKRQELILDNNDLERERGITILSKNVSVVYNDVKINIIDTPGHADFGGEVERVLNMADGVILLVDAFEGTMPQTRFVLSKALALGLKPIVVINKVDKPNCRPDFVHEQVFDLMYSLNATDDQLDFPTVYGSAKEGWMTFDLKDKSDNIAPLMDYILKYIPAPVENPGTPQMLITSLDYNAYVGRIAIGRIHRGELKDGMTVSLVNREGVAKRTKIKEIHTFTGLGQQKIDKMSNGDICALVGIEGFEIGDSICDPENPEPLAPVKIDEPTMSMLFTINNSPFFGREGKFVTSRHIKERLDKELEKNLALRVKPGATADSFIVYGRGVMHLSVLIETMRREGYELQLGQPKVLIKEIDGKKCEPIEQMDIDVATEYSGKVIDSVTLRKAEMQNMEIRGDRTHFEFVIPSRGIIGLRTQMMTATAGEAVINHRFLEYQPWKGDIEGRKNGSLVAKELGTTFAYALNKLQDRGRFFVGAGVSVYEGMVIGENNRADDITVNVTQSKKLTNMRAAGTDEKSHLFPPIKFSLEESMEYINEDEYLEVTPKSLRMRKILLHEAERKRNTRK